MLPYQSVRSRHQINIGGTFLFVCLGSRPKINKDSAIIFSIWQSLGEQKRLSRIFIFLQFLWKSYLRRDLLKPEFLISVQRILKPNLVRREGGQRELKGCIIISRRNHNCIIIIIHQHHHSIFVHLQFPHQHQGCHFIFMAPFSGDGSSKNSHHQPVSDHFYQHCQFHGLFPKFIIPYVSGNLWHLFSPILCKIF